MTISTEHSSRIIFEDNPQYDLWLKLILGGIPAITFILGVVLLSSDLVTAMIMFGVTIFDALLFHAVLPRRYQIFPDKLRIALGRPFAVNIPLATITEARSASGAKAFAYWGIRFATSSRNVVEIVRHKGMNVVISPSRRDLFLEQMEQVLLAMSA